MKVIYLLLTTLFLTTASSAQLNLSAKAGLNQSNYRGTDSEGVEGRIGFHVGIASELSFGNFAFAPELLYSAQGIKGVIEETKVKINASYITVPLLARYRFDNGLFLETGIQPGFLMSADVKVDGGGSASVKDEYRKVDLAVPFGIGFQTRSNFGIGLRYNLGLSSIDKDGEGKVYTGVAQLSFTYRLFNK